MKNARWFGFCIQTYKLASIYGVTQDFTVPGRQAAHGCEACGIIGVKAIVKSAKEANMSVDILDYRTSGDVSKEYDRVVGYTSAIFY